MTGAFPPGQKRWSFEQFMALADSGFFDENPRVELIGGLILEKMPQKHPHATVVMLLDIALKQVFGLQAGMHLGATVRLGPEDGPEPDITLYRGSAVEIAANPPGVEDIRLLIEVGDATFKDDLRAKAPLYARFNIPEFWLVDVNGRRVIVHRSPNQESSTWNEVMEIGEDGEIFPLGSERSIAISVILPPVVPSQRTV